MYFETIGIGGKVVNPVLTGELPVEIRADLWYYLVLRWKMLLPQPRSVREFYGSFG